LMTTLAISLQREAEDPRTTMPRPQTAGSIDIEEPLHDLKLLTQMLEEAKKYRTEMEFAVLEAEAVLHRLTGANVRWKMEQKVHKAELDPKKDEDKLTAALDAAEAVGVEDTIIEVGRRVVKKWNEVHKRDDIHNELHAAVRELRNHVDHRTKPGAGAEEQKRVRVALVKAALPADSPQAMEAVELLKRWEADNIALRAEARLLNAVARAEKGFKPTEAFAGDLLGSAIAEVSQQGIDAKYLDQARSALAKWQSSRLARASNDLELAMQYRDQDFLVEAIALARASGVEKEQLELATRVLQQIQWEEEVNKLFETAMEAGEMEMLERAIQRAHEATFLEEENDMLKAGLLQYRMLFWTKEFQSVPMAKNFQGLVSQVAAADQLIVASKEAKVELDKPGMPDVVLRTLGQLVRGLELVLPGARKLGAVDGARNALTEVLGAVERHAERLPEVIARGEKQVPQGLEQTLVDQAKKHLEAYESAVNRLTTLVDDGCPPSQELKDAFITARMAGAPADLIKRAATLLEEKYEDLWKYTQVELEMRLALAEADDIEALSVENRFQRLQDATDAAKALQPPLEQDLFGRVDGLCLALAAESTFVVGVQEAEAVYQGTKVADGDATIECAKSLERAINAAQEDAQEAALDGVPAAEDLAEKLKAHAKLRKEALAEVNSVVQARASTMRDIFAAIVEARAMHIPRPLLESAYERLRKKKLEFCSQALKTAKSSGEVARAMGLWQRGVALRAREERGGEEWVTGELSHEPKQGDFSFAIQGEFIGAHSGGAFGSRMWRKNPTYSIRSKYDEEAMKQGPSGRKASVLQNVKVTVVMSEMAEMPSTLAVHVVRNSEQANEAGFKHTLVPGFEVIASSDLDDDIPDLTFELPPAMEEADDDWPVFIVCSAATGEEGPFKMCVDATMPVEVARIADEVQFPWKDEQVQKLEWARRRPFEISMGGGRVFSTAPMISWYRNPQFRVRLADRAAVRKASGIEDSDDDDEVILPAGFGGREEEEDDTTKGPLFLALLVPESVDDAEPAAVHIVRNRPGMTTGQGLVENPQRHDVIACSGAPGSEYARASEMGAGCALPLKGEDIIVVPSLEKTRCEGLFTLKFFCTEKIVVERVE